MSTSSTLFFVALVCMFAVVQAAPGLNSLVFDNPTCTGQAFSNKTVSTGVCTANNLEKPWLGYHAQYCTADGTSYYTFQFSDSACTVATAYSADQVDGSCRTYGPSSMKTQCVGGATAASMPLSFPPAQWRTTTTCVNTTTDRETKQCNVVAADVKCTNSASRIGYCTKMYQSGTNITIGSKAEYCSGTGAIMGQLVYAGETCTGAVIRARIAPTTCNSGSVTSCPSGVATLPSTLPTAGVLTYDNPTCTLNPYRAPDVMLYSDSCYDSDTLKCSTNVNGTQIATYSTFTDLTNKGLCTVAQSTKVQKAEQCIPNGEGQGVMYTCSYNPGQLNSASSLSFSAVMMFSVTILALIAGRTL